MNGMSVRKNEAIENNLIFSATWRPSKKITICEPDDEFSLDTEFVGALGILEK